MFKTSSKTKSQCDLLVAKRGGPLPLHCFAYILPLLGHGGWPSLWKRANSQSMVLRHAHTRTSKQALEVLNTFRDGKLCLLSSELSPVLHQRSWDCWTMSVPGTSLATPLPQSYARTTICLHNLHILCSTHHSPLLSTAPISARLLLMSPPATSVIWVICQQSSCLNCVYVKV